ncbi:MAG: carbohydrate-binding family 9-like protein [bacterium]
MLKRAILFFTMMYWAIGVAVSLCPADTNLVLINKTKLPPKIDGKLDDTVWQKSSFVSGFVLTQGKGTPANKTRFYLLYDSNNLYVGARCEEKALEAVMMQQTLFKKDKTARDAALWEDDCIEIFLDPTNSQTNYYHYVVNSLGATYDAKCSLGVDMNSKWNSNVIAVGHTGEGFWSVEVAIPFKDLGLSPPILPGQKWRVNFCREEKPYKENSSWSPIIVAFHTPKEFGEIVFNEEEGAFVKNLREDVKGNKGMVSVEIKNNSAAKKTIACQVKVIGENTSSGNSKRAQIDPGEIKNIEFAYKLKDPGKNKIIKTVHDLTGDALLYRKTDFSAVTLIPFELKASGYKYQLYVNGKKILDSAGKKTFSGGINKGLNVIGIMAERNEVDAGISLEISFPSSSDKIRGDNSWKCLGQYHEGWNTVNFDDSGWQMSKNTSALHSMWGDGSANKMYFRKIVEVDEFVGLRDISLSPDYVQQLNFILVNTTAVAYKNYNLIIETPENIELLNPIRKKGMWEGLRNIPQGAEEERISKAEKSYRRYTISFKESLKPYIKSSSLGWYEFPLFFKTSTKLLPGTQGQVLYRYIANDGSILSLTNRIKYNVIPAFMAQKRPKQLEIVLDPEGSRSVSAREWEEYIAKTLVLSGATRINMLYRNPEIIKAIKVAHINPYCWFRSTWDFEHPYIYKSDHAEAGRVFFDDKRSNTMMCPEYFVRNNEFFDSLKLAIKKIIEKCPFTGFYHDHEPIESESCYCERCLTAFAKYLGKTNIKKEEIKNYPDKWIDFRCRQEAAWVGIIRKAMKEVDPRLKLIVYSAGQAEWCKKRYLIDWNYMAQSVDGAQCGYGRQKEMYGMMIRDILKDKPLVGGVQVGIDWISINKEKMDKNLNPELTKVQMFEQVLDCKGGAMIFAPGTFDAAIYTQIASASEAIAEYEDFFQYGVRKDELARAKIETAVLVKDGNRIVVLFNRLGRRLEVELRNLELPPAADIVAYDYDNKKVLTGIDNLRLVIPPNDVKIIWIGPKK